MKNESFLQFWEQFCAGQSVAQIEFYERFASQLAWLARQRLSERIKQRVESDDIVQSVLGTFIRRQKEGGFQPISWNSLWNYLEGIAIYKCLEKNRHLHRQSRNIDREQHHSRLPADDSGCADTTWHPASREPLPGEVSVVIDLVEQLHRKLPESHWPILKLLLDGSYTQQEISNQTNFSERTVRRVLKQVEELLRGMMAIN